MMNWNGFFARKFDLDNLVTTLSGGNGAGKSTTMAAFITALIPDLSLLHFRNTTEAGSTSSSRDRGLHGKLKSGVCYSALECVNSRGETMIFGVRLQQVTGRDKKVDLKLFSIAGLTNETDVTGLFLQKLVNEQGKVKIIPFNDLKERCEELGLTFKAFHSLGDYHAQMFDYGFLPKRLGTSQDRSKFYRLIEASLYGGISTTITKSLREYLLPEQAAIRKVFQDMESALVENRMTLNKIEQTKADRNFFRGLVDAAVDYVASDYVYQHNARSELVKQLLQARNRKQELVGKYTNLQQAISNYETQQAQLQQNYNQLLKQYEQANEYYHLLVNAHSLQQQYNDNLAKVQSLSEEVEIATAKSEDLAIERETLNNNLAEQEVQIKSLYRQLNDAQSALDQQATRQVQYKQAVQKLADFKQSLSQHQELLTPEGQKLSKNLELEQVAQVQEELNKQLQQVNAKYYEVDGAVKVSATSKEQHAKVLAALHRVSGEKVQGTAAYNLAAALVKGSILKRDLAQRAESLSREFNSLAARREQALESNDQVSHLQQQLGQSFSNRDELNEYFAMTQAAYAEVEVNKADAKDQLGVVTADLSVVTNRLQGLNEQRLPYLAAQEQLQQINAKLEIPLTDLAAARSALDKYLTLSNNQGLALQNLENSKETLQNKIYRIEKQGLGIDQQLQYVAQDLNGVLLSEIYDDVSLEDASYYSALYGPARDAIVVPSIAEVKAKLKDLKDLPEDLYLIEADFKDFNENMFDSEAIDDKSVLVQINEHQVRLSSIREATTFGKAAREKFLENAKSELKDTLYQLNELEKEYFNNKALAESLTSFIAQYGDLAFRPNPKEQIDELTRQSAALEREASQLRRTLDGYQQQINEFSRQNTILHKLLGVFSDSMGQDLEADYQRLQSEVAQAHQAQRYLQQHGADLELLETDYNLLQFAAGEVTELNEQLTSLKAQQTALNALVHLADEVLSRQAHFAYADLGELAGNELADKLRRQLETLEEAKSKDETRVKLLNSSYEQERQQLFKAQAELESARNSLEHLNKALSQTGTNITNDSLEKAKAKAAKLLSQVEESKEQIADAKNQHAHNQERVAGLEGQIAQAKRDFSLQQANVADNKAKWRKSQDLAQEHNLSHRLANAAFLGLSNEELRSKSDRALGTLRSLISDNEYLRDRLKESEDSRNPHKKVEFFISVYQHLSERIRQDILTTSDPIEAIEQMDIQLNLLASKLEEREESLKISARDVADLLDKTIEREQNRIYQLNQGLQQISFGQIRSVRLEAIKRDSHRKLLEALRDESNQNSDIFEDEEISFTEALAKLYQRTNADFDVGTRNYQTIGEELLDYRNYIDLSVEVYRGADEWIKAESGALSTGEAIGTGMSILLMVVQSWEEESRRLRAKDLRPCRLLFLDEAARLDSKSIATLFELCDRQSMQLVIAAPENIAPENGTTYKLIRKIEGNREFVQVVGLRGFGSGGETVASLTSQNVNAN